jgi:DNA invertase Pin-like site-specific DNA recombinase
MRRLYRQGRRQTALAREFGVSVASVSRAVRGDHWSDVDEPGLRKQTPPNARLTPDQVLAIRRRAATGEPKAGLAREYGVSRSALSEVIAGRTWRDLAG